MTSKTLVRLLPFSLTLLMAGQATAKIVTSSLQLPFMIDVFVGNVPQPEMVTLSGKIHILTHVTQPGDPCSPGDPCRGVPIGIHTNLDNVEGMGKVTGMTYHADGVFRMDSTFTMPGSFAFLANFRLLPGDPCAPGDPCRSLPITLTLDSQGMLTNAVVGGQFDLGVLVPEQNPATPQVAVALVANRLRRRSSLAGRSGQGPT